MSRIPDTQDTDPEVWPPPITLPPPTAYVEMLTEEPEIVRSRWFFLFLGVVMTILTVACYIQHGGYGTLFVALWAVAPIIVAVQGWRLKARLNRSEASADPPP